MLNILLVDDDVEFSDVVCHIVEFLGHNISTATSLKEAHQWFENNAFDHVLLDFMLPDGCGAYIVAEEFDYVAYNVTKLDVIVY